MIYALAGVLTLVFVGIPLLTAPSTAILALGAIAGLVCGGAIVRLSVPLLTVGVSIGLVEYALAVVIAGGSPDFGGASVLAVALALLVHVVGFGSRFRGVTVEPRALRDQVRVWIGAAAASVAALIVLAIGAGSFRFRLPTPAYPALAALGVLAAFVGVVQTVLRSEVETRSQRERETSHTER